MFKQIDLQMQNQVEQEQSANNQNIDEADTISATRTPSSSASSSNENENIDQHISKPNQVCDTNANLNGEESGNGKGNQDKDWTPVSSAAGRRQRRKSKYLNDFYCVSSTKGGRLKVDEYDSCTTSPRSDRGLELHDKHCSKCGGNKPHDRNGTCQSCLYKRIVASHKSKTKKDKSSNNNINNRNINDHLNNTNIKSSNNNNSNNLGSIIKTKISKKTINENNHHHHKYHKYNEIERKIVKLPKWTPNDVANYISTLGFINEAPSFESCSIDGVSLYLMQRFDFIKHLPIKLGPALKIYDQVCKLKLEYIRLRQNCENANVI